MIHHAVEVMPRKLLAHLQDNNDPQCQPQCTDAACHVHVQHKHDQQIRRSHAHAALMQEKKLYAAD
jgi:hypothetical protein